jgi:hypothetical protein
MKHTEIMLDLETMSTKRNAAIMAIGAAEMDFENNGVTFDNVIIDNTILRDAFERLEWQCPWPSWNDMCYRTMQSMYPEVKAPKRVGVAHNALDDAKSQACMNNQAVSGTYG